MFDFIKVIVLGAVMALICKGLSILIGVSFDTILLYFMFGMIVAILVKSKFE